MDAQKAHIGRLTAHGSPPPGRPPRRGRSKNVRARGDLRTLCENKHKSVKMCVLLDIKTLSVYNYCKYDGCGVWGESSREQGKSGQNPPQRALPCVRYSAMRQTHCHYRTSRIACPHKAVNKPTLSVTESALKNGSPVLPRAFPSLSGTLLF